MYDHQDISAILREHPRFAHGLVVKGPRLVFREAKPADAKFVLGLRLDEVLNQHLSAVADDLDAQIAFIVKASDDEGQIYYIIENEGCSVGTVRLYDQRGTSFSWGSWILKGAPAGAARESMRMVYALGTYLGFKACHFDVRKANEKVWKFHESVGAERMSEDAISYHYEIRTPAIQRLADAIDARISG